MVVGALLVGVLGGCQANEASFWTKADFAAAASLARQRNTSVMLYFYTDWCSWCHRLSSDTFTNPEVQEALAGYVAVKANAEGAGARLAERYQVTSYPTIVFVDTEGEELDRITGYLPPRDFLAELRRIKGPRSPT